MIRKPKIAALIEKNRIALLRLVFCWLTAACAINVRGDKPLPRRLAAWVEELLFKAEKATGYLLIALFYQGQIKRRFSPAFEKEVMRLIASNRHITLAALTITGIIKRLKALQYLLHNLRVTARRMAKSYAAHARIAAMKIQTLAFAQAHSTSAKNSNYAVDDALLP